MIRNTKHTGQCMHTEEGEGACKACHKPFLVVNARGAKSTVPATLLTREEADAITSVLRK